MSKFLIFVIFICTVGFINSPVLAQVTVEELLELLKNKDKDSVEFFNSEGWIWRKGTDSAHVKRTRTELDSLLAKHRIWADSIKIILYKLNRENKGLHNEQLSYFLDTCTAIGNRLDLHGAHLNYANLDSAMLNYASFDSINLEHASLRSSSLKNAEIMHTKLAYTDFSNAVLRYANLTKANFYKATLDNANFSRAMLKGASFRGADLRNATFRYADLSNAYLIEGNLNGVSFWDADLQGAYFEPDSLPIIHSISRAKNLDSLTFRTNPSKLKELQIIFSERGYKQQERKIICALRRSEKFENVYIKTLDWLMFDYTSEYGSNLNLPWKRLGIIYLICAALYYLSMLRPFNSGIHLITDGIKVTSEEDEKEKLNDINQYIYEPNDLTWLMPIHIQNIVFKDSYSKYAIIPMWIRLIWWSMFFSAMSTFNIGFRDINFGRWLKMLTRKEFDLQPFGWIRVVAGFQALISVYLIALWVLSFAGTPFK